MLVQEVLESQSTSVSRDYNGLGMVLLALFVVVVAIEFFSEYLRKKLS